MPFFFSKVTLKSIILKIFKHNLCDPSSDTIQFQVVKTWNKRERNAPLELRLSKKNNSCACNECIRVIFFAFKNVGTCEISEASCTHKSKKHAGEKRSFAFSTQSCHPRWLAACKIFSFCCRRFTLKKLINGSNWISWECSLLTQKYFRLSLLSGNVSECGGLGKILKFFKGNLGMSAFCSCILSYNFLTLFELSRSGQGLTI